MGPALAEKQTINAKDIVCHRMQAIMRSCLHAWEIYPIILVASFLRLYRLDTTAFSGDQSTLFRLAYDAVHQHYLLLTIPGQFILVGFFIVRVLAWFQARKSMRLWRGIRCAAYALTTLVLIVQLAGSTASLIDTVHGINSHVFGYNDIGSLQHALREADQLAQQRRLNRVYISMSNYDDSLQFLVTFPYTIALGPLRFETAETRGSPVTLRTVDGSDNMVW